MIIWIRQQAIQKIGFTNAEDTTSSSATAPDIKENNTKSLQGTAFVLYLILPKPAPSENKKENQRDSKKRNELDEEERKNNTYILHIWNFLKFSWCFIHLRIDPMKSFLLPVAIIFVFNMTYSCLFTWLHNTDFCISLKCQVILFLIPIATYTVTKSPQPYRPTYYC